MNGVETVSTFIEAIETKRNEFHKERNITEVYDLNKELRLIRENIKNLFNTNDFMLMTINRCIDYTKVIFIGLFCLCKFLNHFSCNRQARASNWTRASRPSIWWRS